MPDQGESSQREVAQRIAASADEVERAKLLAWAFRLVQIRDGSGSLFAKGRDALSVTFSEGVAWPVVKLIGAEMRRLAWDERGLIWRAGFITAIAGGILTGGSGAGIAALGGAIGVPLWLVLGAGGSFLAMLYEELVAKEAKGDGAPKPVSTSSALEKQGSAEVVDVQAKVVGGVRLPCEQALLESERGIRPGDTLHCGGCGHEREVSQTWLDTLARRYTPTAAGRLTSLDGKVLRKLKCSECGSKELQLVVKSGADDLGRYQLCGACGGDGGYEGRCYKCFGSGFEQASP
jgi:hypothetical protein